MMPRLKRRLQIPRQRQTRCFDPEQYYLEEADYARAVRKVRVLLRQNQPVLLMAEEWPLDLQCLVDLSASLQWSRPELSLHICEVGEVRGWDVEETEHWLLSCFTDAMGLPSVSRMLARIREPGFTACLSALIEEAPRDERHGLCLHGFHLLHPRVRRDLSDWIASQYWGRQGALASPSLLLTGPLGSTAMDIEGGRCVVLRSNAVQEEAPLLLQASGS